MSIKNKSANNKFVTTQVTFQESVIRVKITLDFYRFSETIFSQTKLPYTE